MLSQQVKAMKWTLRGEKERLMVVGKSGAVYVWDKEGWVDEEQDAARGNEEGQDESGVVEGVGIPNSESCVLSSDYLKSVIRQGNMT